MLPLTVGELVKAAQGVLIVGDPMLSVGSAGSLSIDSRTMSRGDVFFAIVGERFDGHQFINQAIQKGAAACVVSQIPVNLNMGLSHFPVIIKVRDTKKALLDTAKFYRAKYGKGTEVVGVSGSCGKTTVKEMIAQILKHHGPTVYSQGNLNNEIGCPLSIMALNTNHKYGVFEIGGSAVGDVKKLADIVAPKTAVITNVLLEHTATFGTLENIAEGESEILLNLPSDGCAILPRDDAFYDYLKSRAPAGTRIKSFGFSNQASLYIANGPKWRGAQTVSFVHQDDSEKILEKFECALPVMGKFNMLNACAAAAAALSLNVPIDAIRAGLENFSSPGMRFEMHELQDEIVVINDCYNANPGSMRAALEGFVDSFSDKRRCLVLGDMLELGEISRQEHYELGKYIATLPISKLVLYGPQAQFIKDGAQDAFIAPEMIQYCKDKEILYQTIRSLMESDTAFLFKASRGMKLEEIIKKII